MRHVHGGGEQHRLACRRAVRLEKVWRVEVGRVPLFLLDAELSRHGIRERQPWWSLIRLAFSSPARVAMIQAQDVLGLGSKARMNVPARAAGNWRWRLSPGALNKRLALRLREVTEEPGACLNCSNEGWPVRERHHHPSWLLHSNS